MIRFKAQKGDVSLDFAGFRVMKGVVVFVYSLNDPETIKSTLRLVILILIITESHHYLCEIIRILVLLKIIEDIECSLLGLNSLIKVLSFCIDFGHL